MNQEIESKVPTDIEFQLSSENEITNPYPPKPEDIGFDPVKAERESKRWGLEIKDVSPISCGT